jgi:flavin-dependent dehydrogenase
VTDVFVVGGGPAGLAAAIAARQRGFDVLVSDCSAPPIDKACGEGIMPDGLAAARALGLELEGAGYRFRGIGFSGGGRTVAADFPEGTGLGVRRTLLHEMMLDRAASLGVRFAWGKPIAGLSEIRARWIVGADGSQSAVRRWGKLDACKRDSRRFGFRKHYRIAPWSEYMQIHWGEGCQLYITPVAEHEVCVVLISRDPHLRLDAALPQFPEVVRRLEAADSASVERGAMTATRSLNAVVRGNLALVGDASGSVDAITGEGLCLLFQQSVALARAMEAGDLSLYQAEHRRIGRRPRLMADLMLLLDGRRDLRTRALGALSADPRLFSRMLAMHIGELSPFDFCSTGLALGYRMLAL